MKRKSVLPVYIITILLVFTAAGILLSRAVPPALKPEEITKIKPEILSIGSGSPGGTSYLYAKGWAKVAAEALDIQVKVDLTDGPHHNLILLEEGTIYLGMTTMGPAYEAWNGLEDWTAGVEHKNMRSLFPMFYSYFHWIADSDKEIRSLHDMEGKKVGSGPAAGTIGIYGPRFFSLLGINAELVHGAVSELTEKQKQGELDANGAAAGIPFNAYKDYEKAKGAKKIVYIGINGRDRENVKSRWPYFSDAIIPAATYGALDSDLETVGMWSVAVASKYLDDEYVYTIVKAVMENNDTMISAGHDAARETVIENLKYLELIPLHPGAIRYYRETGHEIPNHLLPPEMTN